MVVWSEFVDQEPVALTDDQPVYPSIIPFDVTVKLHANNYVWLDGDGNGNGRRTRRRYVIAFIANNLDLLFLYSLAFGIEDC